MEEDELNVNEICRGCKKNGTAMASIYFDNDNDPGYPRIDEMLMACATLNVQEGDGLPSLICVSCLGRVKIAYTVKQDLERIDAELRIYVAKHTKQVKDPNNADMVNRFLNNFFENESEHDDEDEEGEIQTGDSSQELETKPYLLLETQMTEVHCKDNSNDDLLAKVQGNVDDKHIKCPQCVKTFATIESYTTHKKTDAHLELKQTQNHIFKCKHCDKHYRSLKSLRRHTRRYHEKSKMFQCTICNKQFTRLEHMKRHLYTHLKEKPFACDICKRGFNRPEHLANHLALCDGSRSLACDICNKGFSNEITLEIHKKMHENYNFKKMSMLTLDDIEHCERFYSEVECDRSANVENGEHDDRFDLQSDDEEAEINRNDSHMVKLEGNHQEFDESDQAIIESYSDSQESEYSPSTRKSTRFRKKKRSVKVSMKKSCRKRGRPPKRKAKDCAEVGAIETQGDSANQKEDEGYVCPICNETFTRITLLEAHGKEHHENEKVLRCKLCEMSFSRVYALKCHLNSHIDKTDSSSEQSKSNSCTVCSIAFDSNLEVVQHFNEHHPLMETDQGVHEFSCHVCCKMFEKVDQLEEHKLQEDHQDVDDCGKPEKKANKRFPCDKCIKCFTTEKYLNTHKKKHDDEGENFVCPKCSKPFLSKSNLTEHLKFHNEKSKKYLCSECGQRFIRNDYLVIHMRRHRGEKPFKCKFCGKGFPRATDLTVHERYHTGEKTHLCVVCGRGFGRAYNLTVHMRTHTGEKPYKCPYCESAFAQCNDLKAHVRRHTGERFQCDLCPETFLMGYALTQHKRTVHGLNIVSNIRRLQPLEKLHPNDPPPMTVKLPRPIVPSTAKSVIYNEVPGVDKLESE